MNYLEELLERKSKLEKTEVYLSQWIYDKEIYKDMLKSIKDYYSNFTDHGNKHSETILNIIIRIFGKEALEELSSLDIFLLLEAAYMHDCGMYISLEKAKEILLAEEFREYFKDIQNQDYHPLHEYTKKFKINPGEKFSYTDNEYTPETEYGMRFIIASYMRSSHAKDSGKSLKERQFNYIIPRRIFGILSLIVEAHSFDFQDVMKIPQKESGIGLEEGHPRFIACLLRIGDLLDLDNNRISPTILNNIKNIIPVDSMEHIIKHRSITHYRVDNKKIEVTATIETSNCDTENEGNCYNISNITNQWFDFIRSEFSNQLLVWDEIRPLNFNAYLPIVGDLNVNLIGYDFINSKEKPQFKLDIDNVFKLLVGNGIYKNKETAMRELIQNSIDATYIRAYEEEKNRDSLFREIDLKKRKEIFEKKKIRIDINKKSSETDYNFWEIKIKDSGIGLDKEKLKYIIEAGSSYKDKRKNLTIEKMPQWMLPSGNFGIGFQSIFLLTDRVNIKSKGLYTNESMEATLFSPISPDKNKGDVFIKSLPFNYEENIGTEISFIYKTEKNADSYTISYGRNGVLEEYIANFDPLLDTEFDLEIIKLIDEISEVNSYSLVDIELYHETKEIILEKKSLLDNDVKFFKEYKIEVTITKDINDLLYSHNANPIVYYKNQKIKDSNFRIDYLNCIINILGYKASEALEINREKLKSDFVKKYRQELFFSIFKYIKEELEPKFKDLTSHFKLRISMFIKKYSYYYQNYIKINPEISSDLINFYKTFDFGDIDKKWNFDNLKKKEKIKIKVNKNSKDYREPKVLIDKKPATFGEVDLINWLYLENKYITTYEEEKKEDESRESSFTIELEKVDTEEDEKIKIDYSKLFDNSSLHHKLNKRFYFPNNGKFNKLRLKENIDCSEQKNYGWINYFPLEINENYISSAYIRNKILFPFFLKKSKKGDFYYIWNSETRRKYVDFQFKNRYNENLEIEDIQGEVDRLVEYLEKDIFKDFEKHEEE